PGLLRGTGVRRHASLPTLPLPGRALAPASPATLTTAAIPIRATARFRDTAPPADVLRPAAAATALAAGSPAAAPKAPVGITGLAQGTTEPRSWPGRRAGPAKQAT